MMMNTQQAAESAPVVKPGGGEKEHMFTNNYKAPKVEPSESEKARIREHVGKDTFNNMVDAIKEGTANLINDAKNALGLGTPLDAGMAPFVSSFPMQTEAELYEVKHPRTARMVPKQTAYLHTGAVMPSVFGDLGEIANPHMVFRCEGRKFHSENVKYVIHKFNPDRKKKWVSMFRVKKQHRMKNKMNHLMEDIKDGAQKIFEDTKNVLGMGSKSADEISMAPFVSAFPMESEEELFEHKHPNPLPLLAQEPLPIEHEHPVEPIVPSVFGDIAEINNPTMVFHPEGHHFHTENVKFTVFKRKNEFADRKFKSTYGGMKYGGMKHHHQIAV